MSGVGMSPLAMAAKRLIDATWLTGPAYDLASQAAFALESAQMLQSPETAAERAAAEDALALLDRTLAELKREHAENARLRARIAELEQAAACQSVASVNRARCCLPVRHRGDHRTEDKRQFWSDEFAAPPSERAERSADRLTRMLAPTQALREVPDGEHYEAVHHTYRLSHDLPETGGAL